MPVPLALSWKENSQTAADAVPRRACGWLEEERLELVPDWSDEETNAVGADLRNFYKIEKWKKGALRNEFILHCAVPDALRNELDVCAMAQSLSCGV